MVRHIPRAYFQKCPGTISQKPAVHTKQWEGDVSGRVCQAKLLHGHGTVCCGAVTIAKRILGWLGLEGAVLEHQLLVMGPILHPGACPPSGRHNLPQPLGSERPTDCWLQIIRARATAGQLDLGHLQREPSNPAQSPQIGSRMSWSSQNCWALCRTRAATQHCPCTSSWLGPQAATGRRRPRCPPAGHHALH